MKRLFSMAFLTAMRLAPHAAVRVAAQTGYQAVGLRLLPSAPGGAAHPLHTDPAALRETLAAMAGTGIAVFDLEIIRLTPGVTPASYEAFFATGARLGARAVLVAGDDPDPSRLIAAFAEICQIAAPHGLTCDLEFMPWTPVNTAAIAHRIVTAAAQPNGRVLVDALHVARSATTPADLAAIPPALLSYAQICDAPPEIPADEAAMIFTARSERMLPGTGGIDLASIFAQLPPDLPISVEVPSESHVAALGDAEWARRALAASRAVLAP